MNPIGRALWYIESHFREEVSLDDVAEVAGVSRFHLSRGFAATVGPPLMRYVRARRLSEAAKVLAGGADDILTVALDAGYGSHEAFTRAFRDRFGLTPEAVRAQRHLDNLDLQEPIRMDDVQGLKLAPPRLVTHRALLVAGVSEHYSEGNVAGIPAQWQRFAPYLGAIPGQTGGRTTYGVCYNVDGVGMDYMCAVEVKDFAKVPRELSRLSIGEHLYAVFTHQGHVTAFKAMWKAIFTDWLPGSGYEIAQAPDFERYGEAFDPARGEGTLEIWVPVKKKA